MLSYHTAATAAAQIEPTDIYCYFDVVRLWLCRPLSKNQCERLHRSCRKPSTVAITNGRCWFDHRYSQKVELYQPSQQTLRCLCAVIDDEDEPLLNYVELACDLILPNHRQAIDLHRLFERSFLHPWHRAMVPKSYGGEGFTTREIEAGENRAGRWFVWYVDQPCKLTGEVDGCFHFEGRHQGVQYMRRLGIRQPRDLLRFDLDAYFRRYMRLYDLDCERLGRYDGNKRSGTKRRKPDIRRTGLRHEYNRDRGYGESLYYVLSLHPTGLGHSLQRFVDCYGPGPFLSPPVSFYVHVRKSIIRNGITSYPTTTKPITPVGTLDAVPDRKWKVRQRQHAIRYPLRGHGDHDADADADAGTTWR
jgi:hypothetical protein